MGGLSIRTERTSSNLQDTTPSMDRIAGSVQASAGHPSQAASIADANLPAAVEAARAGEAGRGFAVVRPARCACWRQAAPTRPGGTRR